MASSDYVRGLLHEQTQGMFNPEEEDADECFCKDAELVSVICPTSAARHTFHPFLYRCFCRQTYMPCEMIVVDAGVGASARSKFFTSGAAAEDPRMKYRYFDVKEEGKLWSIGVKRNIACYLAHGHVIVHFDDGNIYEEEYVEWVLQALRWGSVQCDTKVTFYNQASASDESELEWAHYSAKAVTLSRWYAFDLLRDDFFHCGPEHEIWILGCGFSYAYLREVWCLHPFQDVNLGQDFLFMKVLLDDGLQVALLSDTVGFCAHTLDQSNTSGVEDFLVYEHCPPKGIVGSARLLKTWVTNPKLDEFPVDRDTRMALQIKEEMIRMFATDAFQKEIRDAAQSARTPARKEGAIQMISVKYQSLIVPKFGFPGSTRGVVSCRYSWPLADYDPELMFKNRLVMWLMNPDSQEEHPLREWVPGMSEQMLERDCLAALVEKALRLGEELGLRERGPLSRLLSPVVPTQQAEDPLDYSWD